jgi:predicted ATPase with chaperone activity
MTVDLSESLAGALRRLAAAQGRKGVLVPADNAAEAAVVESIEVIPVRFQKKEERNPTHIAAHWQVPQANAATKALPKSALLLTHPANMLHLNFN